MFQNIIEWIKRLFGVKAAGGSAAQKSQERAFAAAYEDVSDINIIAIIANKLANKVCSDSTIRVTGKNERERPSAGRGSRAEFLDDALQRVVRRLKLVTARAFGVGGVVLKPYLYAGRLYTDVLPQSRMVVLEQAGEVVTKAVFPRDRIETEDAVYSRMELHSLDADGNYTIENRALKDENPVELKSVPAWEDIEPVVVITNVERMLWGFVKCPVDDKKEVDSVYGVPVTYGQDKLIKMAVDLINEVPDEYRNKKAFVGADETLFRDDKGRSALPENGLYKLLRANGGLDSQSFWEVFSPEIRHTSYFEGIEYMFGLIEKSMALNKGILTDMQTQNATATEIKRSTADTFSTIDGMRRNIEAAIGQLVYAFDVIANAFGLAPAGSYDIDFDWSYDLLEDSQETFDQIERTVAAGGLGVEYLTAYALDIPVSEAVKYLPEKEADAGGAAGVRPDMAGE